jgi:hypothetical protein
VIPNRHLGNTLDKIKNIFPAFYWSKLIILRIFSILLLTYPITPDIVPTDKTSCFAFPGFIDSVTERRTPPMTTQHGLFGGSHRPARDKQFSSETQSRLFQDGAPFVEDQGKPLLPIMTTQLIVDSGILHAGDEILIYRYPDGDCDTIGWPLRDDQRGLLASALFDERECGTIPQVESVFLPDGEKFNIDDELPMMQRPMCPHCMADLPVDHGGRCYECSNYIDSK